jgi:hypothetical protein
MPISISNEKRTAVRGLGEIALRVNDSDSIQKFYEEVVGLQLMTRFPKAAFFKIAQACAFYSPFSPSLKWRFIAQLATRPECRMPGSVGNSS